VRSVACAFFLLCASVALACTFCGSETQPGQVVCHNCGHRTDAVAPVPLFEQTFELDLSGFQFPTEAFSGQLTAEREGVRSGKQALMITSDDALFEPGQFPVAVVGPIPETTARSVVFWAKSSVPLPLAVGFTETTGAAYTTVVWLSGEKWERIIVDAWELGPVREAPDNNGKLDEDHIGNVFLADTSFLARQFAPNADIPPIRHIFIDDFQIRGEYTRAPEQTEFATAVDRADSEGLRWIPLGAKRATIVRRETPLGELDGAVCVDYELSAQAPFFALMHPAPQTQRVRGAVSIALDLRAERSATFMLQLEERGGGRYVRTLENLLPGQWQTHVLPLAEFQPSDESKDDNGRLDLDQLQNILLLCADGFLKRFGKNTLYLDNFLFLKDPAGCPQRDERTGLPIFPQAKFDPRETEKALGELSSDTKIKTEAANISVYSAPESLRAVAQWYRARLPGYVLAESKAGEEIILSALHDTTNAAYVVGLKAAGEGKTLVRLGYLVSEELVRIYRAMERLGEALGSNVERALGGGSSSAQ